MSSAQAEVESLLRSLTCASIDGIIAFDRECRYVLWNEKMERITGIPAEQVLGRVAFDVFPFLVETGEDQCFRAALAGESKRSVDRPFRVSGSQREGFYDATYVPWRSSAGVIIGGVGVVRDLTEIKRAARELAETERRFRIMADAAPVLLWMANTEGLCTFFNQSWLEFTGRTLEQEWGVGWAESVHFEDFQRCMDTYVQAFNRRATFEMEYRLRRRDGEFRWILDRGTPRFAPDGTFAGFIGSCADISERKTLEQELRKAVRMRDEFLSIASHELRTPLTSLHLQLESLLSNLAKLATADVSTRERVRNNASNALRKSKHLGEMMEVLLDVSRLAEGRATLEYQEFDLVQLTREVMDRLSLYAAEAGCRVDLVADERALGRWDRLRIEQVLTNLLSNAFKYGAKEPVTVEVSINASVVRLRVTDRGPGIPEAEQQRIFERFARLGSTRNYGGFGLGLWITREIASMHRGSVRVESHEGRGSTFEVSLPLRAPEVRDNRRAPGPR